METRILRKVTPQIVECEAIPIEKVAFESRHEQARTSQAFYWIWFAIVILGAIKLGMALILLALALFKYPKLMLAGFAGLASLAFWRNKRADRV